MSKRAGKIHNLITADPSNLESLTLDDRLAAITETGMHGISFSAYIEGQKPGDELTESQIEHRMAILQPHFKWIRSFSTTEGNELIPVSAKRHGLKTLVGAWLGSDTDKNRI